MAASMISGYPPTINHFALEEEADFADRYTL